MQTQRTYFTPDAPTYDPACIDELLEYLADALEIFDDDNMTMFTTIKPSERGIFLTAGSHPTVSKSKLTLTGTTIEIVEDFHAPAGGPIEARQYTPDRRVQLTADPALAEFFETIAQNTIAAGDVIRQLDETHWSIDIEFIPGVLKEALCVETLEVTATLPALRAIVDANLE